MRENEKDITPRLTPILTHLTYKLTIISDGLTSVRRQRCSPALLIIMTGAVTNTNKEEDKGEEETVAVLTDEELLVFVQTLPFKI